MGNKADSMKHTTGLALFLGFFARHSGIFQMLDSLLKEDRRFTESYEANDSHTKSQNDRNNQNIAPLGNNVTHKSHSQEGDTGNADIGNCLRHRTKLGTVLFRGAFHNIHNLYIVRNKELDNEQTNDVDVDARCNHADQQTHPHANGIDEQEQSPPQTVR